MSTLPDFLLARIAEDEAVAKAAIEDDMGSDEGFADHYEYLTDPSLPLGHKPSFGDAAAVMITTFAVPARVLADCAARRVAVDWYLNDDNYVMSATVKAMAAVYADHPDYDEEWRP